MNQFAQNLAKAKEQLGLDGKSKKLMPVAFTVGSHKNSMGENLGSLAMLLYAVGENLTVEKTLPLFGEHFVAVVETPEGTDHLNIRALMKHDKMAYVGSIVTFHGNPIVETKTVDEGIEKVINTAWDNRSELSPSNAPKYLVEAVKYVVYELNVGRLRVATNEGAGEWTVHQWIKKAVLLSFRLRDNTVTRSGDLAFFDKVDTKFGHLNKDEFQNLGARVVPPAVARYGCFIAKGVVLMPSYVNIGAYVDEGTMVDTWATVGSCAQIGKNVHLSGGVGIGGVLEPLQANPTIIEDGCFIGARSEVVEGVIVREGSVLAMGCLISQSTKILNRETGEITYGSIPPYSVVVPGAMGDRVGREHSLYCVVIVKTVDAQTRAKTAINELLRF